jgi:hypothetical protein
MAFDTANPTGGDFHLANDLGIVLIASEDDDSSDPDDNELGGVFTFKFVRENAMINEVLVLDTEEDGFIKVIKENGQSKKFNMPKVANGCRASIKIGVRGAVKRGVKFNGSAAIPCLDVTYCDEPTPAPTNTPTVALTDLPTQGPTGPSMTEPTEFPSRKSPPVL